MWPRFFLVFLEMSHLDGNSGLTGAEWRYFTFLSANIYGYMAINAISTYVYFMVLKQRNNY